MTPELEQLVRDAIGLTGAEPPLVLQDDTPTLSTAALSVAEPFYLVGIIGGKDVGKSALVNAIVGKGITEQTSFGPGTETAIAYAHESQVTALRELLAREIPGKFTIVAHDLPTLRRQVLVDLPDIDSVHSAHIDLTRRLLRHMLYPVWVQSVEKYADNQFQQLLQKVATGNAPENFLFCLNKVDQLVEREGPTAPGELSADYAGRLQRVLKLQAAPRVWMTAAIRPGEFDLPALGGVVRQEKADKDVAASRQLASRRQTVSVLDWIDQLNLAERAARLGRLEEDADELIRDRLTLPMVDRAVPALIDDPAHRLSILDACQWRRASRWPVVNLIHVLVSPVLLLIRRNLHPTPTPAAAATNEALAMTHDRALLASRIQTTFAHLHQAHPAMSSLYHHRRLWEDAPAEMAAAGLQRKVAETLQHQRQTIMARVANRTGTFYAFPRLVLTLGALLWFPFVQPFLQQFLEQGPKATLSLPLLFVRIFGVTSLLQNAAFLILYFVALWLVIRWDTLRLVDRRLNKWRTAANLDPSLNPAAAVLEWTADLTSPIRVARQSVESLVTRAKALREADPRVAPSGQS